MKAFPEIKDAQVISISFLSAFLHQYVLKEMGLTPLFRERVNLTYNALGNNQV